MSDHEASGARGFAAFPARKGGRTRGQSLWAGRWIEALEDTWPEEEPLKKGRAFSRTGRIGPITVSPGRIAAEVHAGEAVHATTLTVTAWDDDDWDLLWERTADRPDATEALLAGDLPEDLLEAAEDARLGLLPGYGDLDADCDCDALDHPCPHATALGYQFSWLLDTDPWLLLLVRGRDTHEALDELKSVLMLRALTATDDDEDDEEEDEGDGGGEESEQEDRQPQEAYESNREAYARPATALPALPPLPEPLPSAAEPVTGIEADPLERLVADAAVRARELLAHIAGFGEMPPAPPLDEWHDTVRIAATHPDPRVPARLREACGRPDDLDRAAEAWRTGGKAGLEVLEQSWTPSEQETARARTALAAGWDDELPPLDVDGNHWTLTGRGLQLRQGRDARWYPYRDRSGTWWPAGPPDTDPAVALSELLALRQEA